MREDIFEIKYIGNRSLTDLSTYREFGGSGWNPQTWTFSSSGSYKYPILLGIPEELQNF
jgi:hypothetical protein